MYPPAGADPYKDWQHVRLDRTHHMLGHGLSQTASAVDSGMCRPHHSLSSRNILARNALVDEPRSQNCAYDLHSGQTSLRGRVLAVYPFACA